MKKVIKYIILTVVLLSDLYGAFFLLLRNIELALALALFIFAGTTLAMLIYHIVNDIKLYKRHQRILWEIEEEKKSKRVKELITAIGGNKYGE